MDIFQSVVLGAVQGITEFIPVSSSGHLMLLSNLLNVGSDAHLFVQALDFGTTLALIIYFRGRIVQLCHQIFVQHDYRLLRNVVITCLPVATIGLLFAKVIESNSFFASSLVIATALAVVGLLMVMLEKLSRLSDTKDGRHLSGWRALIIGLAQCAALIPGVSRSGSTIVASRLMGLKPKEAAEYSFLVCIPVMLGLLGKLIIGDSNFLINNLPSILLGNIIAFVAGILAIRYLLNFLAKHDLKVFGIYRIALAILVVVLVLTGILA